MEQGEMLERQNWKFFVSDKIVCHRVLDMMGVLGFARDMQKKYPSNLELDVQVESVCSVTLHLLVFCASKSMSVRAGFQHEFMVRFEILKTYVE